MCVAECKYFPRLIADLRLTASSGNCVDAQCDGKFVWGDGTAYNFVETGVTGGHMNNQNGNNCFYYNKDITTIDDLTSCGEGDSGYELEFLCFAIPNGPFPA